MSEPHQVRKSSCSVEMCKTCHLAMRGCGGMNFKRGDVLVLLKDQKFFPIRPGCTGIGGVHPKGSLAEVISSHPGMYENKSRNRIIVTFDGKRYMSLYSDKFKKLGVL